jgi:hypothetical protein
VADFNKPATWLPVQQARLVHSPAFHSPMNGQLAAFATDAAAQAAQRQLRQPRQLIPWHEVAQLPVR